MVSGATLIAIPNPSTTTAGKNVVQYAPPISGRAKRVKPADAITGAFDALVLGYYQHGNLLYASRTRNGFTPALRQQLYRQMKPLEIGECPFANLLEGHGGRWGQGLR